MHHRTISVIIPAYNNAEFLADAVQSVLNQTYTDFELIIVNDASPDHVDDVVRTFDDSHVKYSIHTENRGLSAARNTGIQNSTGDYIALLDGDDYFHPDKLKAHVEFLEQHPYVDVTYNARFDLNHSSKTIRTLWRPPLTLGLADLIVGYPFAPSDMVVRRSCIFKVGLFDESHTYYGEDMDINCKLALEGFRFASVDRALNFRRFHSRRVIQHLRAYQEDELRALYKAFTDPRFPTSLIPLRNRALSSRYLGWATFAFLQNESAFGQESLLKAVQLTPSLLDGKPCTLLEYFLDWCTIDDNLDHEVLLRQLLRQLPVELEWLKDEADWAVSRGYLIRATRALMWDRVKEAEGYVAKALICGAEVDDLFLRQLSAQTASYEAEFGQEAARIVLQRLCRFLIKLGGRAKVNWLKGHYAANTGFRHYAVGDYATVPSTILRAISNDPSYVLNRGVAKIFVNSLIKNAFPSKG